MNLGTHMPLDFALYLQLFQKRSAGKMFLQAKYSSRLATNRAKALIQSKLRKITYWPYPFLLTNASIKI